MTKYLVCTGHRYSTCWSYTNFFLVSLRLELRPWVQPPVLPLTMGRCACARLDSWIHEWKRKNANVYVYVADKFHRVVLVVVVCLPFAARRCVIEESIPEELGKCIGKLVGQVCSFAFHPLNETHSLRCSKKPRHGQNGLSGWLQVPPNYCVDLSWEKTRSSGKAETKNSQKGHSTVSISSRDKWKLDAELNESETNQDILSSLTILQ